MKSHRIYAVVLRHWYAFRSSLDRLSDSFYWPTIDLLLWGLSAQFFKSHSFLGENIVIIIVSGVVYWRIVWRAQYEIAINVLQEMWDQNLINLLVTPLTFFEWIVSLLFIGILKGILTLVFAMLVAYLLYQVNIFLYGFYFIPLLLLLIMTGWWIGFLVSGLLLRYGSNIQTIAWSASGLLTPFSAVYYPLSILPIWAQKIALFVPTSYVFEGMRQVLNTGTLDPQKLLMSFYLNCIYLLLTALYLYKSFQALRQKGVKSVY